MFRAIWAIGKTYLTVKAVELVANAFRGKPPTSRQKPATRAKPARG